MFSKKVASFYEFLNSNPSMLSEIRQNFKTSNQGSIVDFVSKKIIPYAKKHGFDLKLSDFCSEGSAALSDDDLQYISGGVNKTAAVVVGVMTFASAILGTAAIKNGVGGFLPTSSTINIKDGTLRQVAEIDQEYEKMIQKEVKAKIEAQEKGLYPKNKNEQSGNFKYGFGNYENQKGTLSLPSGAVAEKLKDPVLKFSQLDGKKDLTAKAIKYKNESPLFRHAPTMKDIQQGAMGNCYFQAVLISVLSGTNGSKEILNMMRDNGDGTVTVRLYDSSQKPRYFTVDKTIPKIEAGNKSIKILNVREHVIWPAILFKAYTAAMNEKGFEAYKKKITNSKDPIAYSDLEFGAPSEVMRCLFGLFSVHYKEIKENISKSNGYSKKQLKVFSRIESSLRDSKPVCAGSRSQEKITNKMISHDHAFSVVNVKNENGKYYLELIDPWRERSPVKGEKNQQTGAFWMELEDFCNNFSSYNF